MEKIVLIAAIWTGAAIYLFPLKHREPIELRMFLCFASGILLSILIEYGIGDGVGVSYLKSACYLVVLSVLFYLCTKSTKSAALYLAIWTLLTVQFVYEIWLIGTERFALHEIFEIDRICFLILGYVLGYVIIELTIARKMPQKGSYKIGPRQLLSAVALLLIFEILYVTAMFSKTSDRVSNLWLPIFLAQFYCVSMLYFQTELFKKSAMEQELTTLNALWQQQCSQYNLEKENIDLINRKCHDLKHQVAAIRGIADEDRKEAYLTEIEQSIQIYDSIVKTGNEVLDTILTGKSLYCDANGIDINCIVDGSQLYFLDPVDLYAILGNAIDNAIEGVRHFREAEKRLIDISIYVKQKFLVISIRNPVRGEIQFQDGLPLSTKRHNGYHGYGLKSIRHNVKRYNGYTNVSIENGCFDLKIIIPIPKENESLK